MSKIAEVGLACGRHYLSVAGITVAMEGDKCRDGELPEEVYEPIPEAELATATIGGKPIWDMDPKVIRFFRGDYWTPRMLQCVADRINRAASGIPETEEVTP